VKRTDEEFIFMLACCLEPGDKSGEIGKLLDKHKDIPCIDDLKDRVEKWLSEEKNRII
jgi:hypothetical protein